MLFKKTLWYTQSEAKLLAMTYRTLHSLSLSTSLFSTLLLAHSIPDILAFFCHFNLPYSFLLEDLHTCFSFCLVDLFFRYFMGFAPSSRRPFLETLSKVNHITLATLFCYLVPSSIFHYNYSICLLLGSQSTLLEYNDFLSVLLIVVLLAPRTYSNIEYMFMKYVLN